MPSLIINKKNKGYKIFKFDNEVKIGRGPDNDIIIDEVSISRNHAKIKESDGEYILLDSSSNGTFVNNSKISEYCLNQGCVFNIMEYDFTFFEESDNDELVLNEFSHESKTICLSENSLDETAMSFDRESLSKEQKEKEALIERLKQFGVIVKNETMLSVFSDARELSSINVPVLITGEPGTGKERVAEILHSFSTMPGDLIPLNCAAIPESIFESELFGSIKGAYSDASDKPGKLELANNGTIFLDEIGDMAVSIQPKLLRFLEDKKLTRLGDNKVKKINVRVVAATNQDLEKMIEEKKFRADLYQRISCIKLHVPPLRERKEDIIPLAEYFLGMFTKEYNVAAQKLSENSKKMMLGHNWPGNIRELRNVLLRAAVKSQKNIIEASHLKSVSDNIKASPKPMHEDFFSLEQMEKKHIEAAVEKTSGNKAMAAKLLGISRDTLYKKIKKYKLFT